MSTTSTDNQASYTRHGAEYKQQRLNFASQLGVAKAARNFKATTHIKRHRQLFDKVLKQDTSVIAPNQRGTGNITYLWTDEGRLYCSVVIDAYSRFMRQAKFEYTEIDNNAVRLHSTTGFFSPVEFEPRFYQSLAS